MKKMILCALTAAGMLLAIGCKAEEEIQNVPTPKPESAEIVINHELEVPEHTIMVSGHGEVIATPDFATITVGVHANGDTAENASAACSEKMQSVYDVALSLGVIKLDITMTGVDITTQQRESDGAIIGYTGAETITIVVRKVNNATNVMSGVIDAGASEIAGITYSLLDSSSAYNQALSAAMAALAARPEWREDTVVARFREVILPQLGGEDLAIAPLLVPDPEHGIPDAVWSRLHAYFAA